MSEQHPEERLEYTGPLETVFARATAAYQLGDFQAYTVVPVGYEDFNAVVQTNDSKYFIKIFASDRPPEEITRYEALMYSVLFNGVRHPKMHAAGDGLVYRDEATGLAMVAMDFVDGQTFYEQQRSPNDAELNQVLEQAVLIHKVPHHPEYLFDSWAVDNLAEAYEPVREYLNEQDRQTVERIINEFVAVDSAALPHCLVHGDLSKSNVLQGDNEMLYVLDFSVANWYPRVQDLAVVAGSLLNDEKRTESLLQLLEKVGAGYALSGGSLTQPEAYALPAYTRAVYATEFIGATREKYLQGNDSEETNHWLELGRRGLKRAYA